MHTRTARNPGRRTRRLSASLALLLTLLGSPHLIGAAPLTICHGSMAAALVPLAGLERRPDRRDPRDLGALFPGHVPGRARDGARRRDRGLPAGREGRGGLARRRGRCCGPLGAERAPARPGPGRRGPGLQPPRTGGQPLPAARATRLRRRKPKRRQWHLARTDRRRGLARRRPRGGGWPARARLYMPAEEYAFIRALHEFAVRLDQPLPFILENAARWQIGLLPPGETPPLPDFLRLIDPRGRRTLDPRRVTIVE